jgi:uncharacterized protein (UPF0335 family)
VSADFRCPDGHVIPERSFDPARGCVILSCRYRLRAKQGPDRLDLEEEDEARRALERKALRGLRGLPEAAAVPTVEPPLMTAWPAELSIEDGRAVMPPERPRDPELIAADRLRQIVERMEQLIEQRREVNAILGDIRAFAKGIGYLPSAIDAVIRMRAQDPEKRLDFEAALETYRAALGVIGPAHVVRLPEAAPPLPAKPAKPTARRRHMSLANLSALARGDSL